MTSTRMGRQYVEEARSRTELVRLARTHDVAALLRREAARFVRLLEAADDDSGAGAC